MPSGFDLDPGGFTDDLSATIADLVFQPGNFGNQAVVTLERDEPFTNPKTGELVNEKTVYIGLPDGWEITNGGTEIVNSDPTRKITETSKWGKWCARVAEIAPEAVDAISAAGGGVYGTAGWAGHRFHFMTEGQGKDYSFKDERTGEQKSGKTKGLLMPVEYLGTKDAPRAGDVGASAPAGFNLSSLPDDVIDTWRPLAETLDDSAFMQAVMTGGLLTQDKLGDAYGPTTKALGDGTLVAALRPF